MAAREAEEKRAEFIWEARAEQVNVFSGLNSKHVLMVLAHCDDEIVCGWPIFQMPHVRKTVLIASSDKNNANRRWCAHRKHVLFDVCRKLDINAHCLDFNSEFYKTPHRGGDLIRLEETLSISIRRLRPYDYVFTHNPHGEYGHQDHKFLFNFVLNHVPEPILITDLVMESDWSILKSPSPRSSRIFYREHLTDVALDRHSYDAVRMEYSRRGVWTWDKEPAPHCRLFVLA